MKMKISNARFITTTAMLLALTIVFQMMRVIIPVIAVPLIPGVISLDQLIIGSLVNLCLIVATATAGIWSGVIISVVAPLVAFAQGHMPLAWMLPFVMIGNASLVIGYGLFMKKSQILGFAIGSVAKTAFLWIGVIFVGINLFHAPEKLVSVLSVSYSWSQLITAVIGGLLSLAVVRALKPKQEA